MGLWCGGGWRGFGGWDIAGYLLVKLYRWSGVLGENYLELFLDLLSAEGSDVWSLEFGVLGEGDV